MNRVQSWLAGLSVNAITIALIVAALVVQTVRIEGFKIWPISVKGYKAEAADLRAELNRISSKRDEQKVVTRTNVKGARKGRDDADGVARRIEAAPVTPGMCQTPESILSADL